MKWQVLKVRALAIIKVRYFRCIFKKNSFNLYLKCTIEFSPNYLEVQRAIIKLALAK
jgi:hypothetical protein